MKFKLYGPGWEYCRSYISFGFEFRKSKVAQPWALAIGLLFKWLLIIEGKKQ